MKPECTEAVEKALGRPLRKGESDKIEKAINLQMRLLARKDPKGWGVLSTLDRLEKASIAAAEQMTAEVLKKQQRVRLQIQIHDRVESKLADRFEQLHETAKPGDYLRAVSNLLAFDAKGRGIASTESWQHSIELEALGKLMPLWNSVKGFAGLFENAKGISDLVHELYGEDTGNAAAKQGAAVWAQVTEELRQRANRGGANIGKLEDWSKPQNHSQGRVAKAGLDAWTEATLPLMDRGKYIREDGTQMDDNEMREFLRNAYDTIITDGQNKVDPGSTPAGAGIANRGSAHRQIFFKDADSWLTYAGQFGDRSLWPTLQGHIRGISRDIGLLETLGPDPEATFNYFNDRTRLDERRMFATDAAKVEKASSVNKAIFDYVAGRQVVGDQRVADIGQAFRNFETATKLGKVALTALGDEAGMAATALANRVPYTQVLARELTYLNPLNAEDRAVAAHTGLGINGAIQGTNRLGYEDLNLTDGKGVTAGMREFTGKLSAGVMRASMAEGLWDTRRRALGSVLMSYLGKWTREVENFSDINETDHGVLATKGVTDQDWKVWKLAQPEDWGMAHGVLTPKSIAAIPDDAMAQLLGRQTKTPPPAAGSVRYYHGGNPEGVTGPLWFTSHLPDAQGWAARGEGMQVHYVDVPHDHPARGEGDPQNGMPYSSRMELPADLANQRQVLDAPAGSDARDIANARSHASTMLLGHVLEELGMGVMDTGARERAGMFLGTQAGTRGGELTRSAFLFKSFGWAMMQKHWARAGVMPTFTDKVNYASRLIVGGAALAAVAIQLRSLFGGKDPENMASPKFWGEALLRGGGFGFYGDFLYSETTSHDTSLIPALMGPLATETETAWNLTGAAAIKASRGERTDEGAKLIRWGRSEIPFLNMWYTQAAMDHILWNDMQEAASPGYLDRMQTKAEVTKGTSWYWDPHDKLPARAPDFSAGHLLDTQRGHEELQTIADTTSKLAESVGIE